MRENIRYIQPEEFLSKRIILPVKERSLFDFLYLTGTRVSESLMVRKEDIDWEKKRVNVYTLKNPTDPYRSVTFFPTVDFPIASELESYSNASNGGRLWSFDHRRVPSTYVWENSRKTFGATTHSFRHTNATLFCRAVRPNLNELMARYGWKDPKPALIYIKYAFDETLDEKIQEFYAKGGKI